MQLIESSGYSIEQAKELLPQLTESERVDFICAACYDDPVLWVELAFPWGLPGPLEKETGPDNNQLKFLEDLRDEVRLRKFNGVDPAMPVKMAITSGHGTGKTAMGGWLASWLLSTRAHSIGTVTAGTFPQLEEKTWAGIKYWVKLSLTSEWFDIQASGIFHKSFPDDWKVTPQTCKKENAQSFAGQHARRSSSWYLFDEASEVPDTIHDTAEGGLTDGEPFMFIWGQPVRNTGRFYEACFGDKKDRWNHRRWEGFSSKFTNKELLKQWENDWGRDSDFFKVRGLGLPPSASELQYIDKARIDAARKRYQSPLIDDPLVAGFDVSGGGKAWNVIRFRRGLCGNPEGMEPWRLAGEKDPDRSVRIGVCAELLSDKRPGRQIAMMFVDSAFGAPIVQALKGMGFKNVSEVTFGSDSPDKHCLNMRAYMWMKAKEFCLLGQLRDDDELCNQLALPGYHIREGGSKLVIESKKSITERGEKSPDDADAFVLTFARAVPAVKQIEPDRKGMSYPGHGFGWA